MKVYDVCTMKYKTLDEAMISVINNELINDAKYNQTLYEVVMSLDKVTSENFKDILSISEMVKVLTYYDYNCENIDLKSYEN